MPAEARSANQTEAKVLSRLKIFRENNGTQTDEKHLLAYFKKLIGKDSCMVKLAHAGSDEAKELKEMQEFLEQNGKPCCVNLITENDSKFLNDLKKPRETPSRMEGEKEEMTEEERAKVEAEAAEAALRALEDEVDVKIREEEDARRVSEQAAEVLKTKEDKLAKDKA
jgi:hypothetical protein